MRETTNDLVTLALLDRQFWSLMLKFYERSARLMIADAISTGYKPKYDDRRIQKRAIK